ncbi:DUF397 domain-containing protein [Streptomyces hesseae]|uniref:DUF397 domain-containing protein n=1 Tax=Streptomyces hesseae TaxID=3075519 RepID=A0ABU2SPE0_9ACTN|nr:DUF397 domain-containing protein [Streptomyces sp. DSM 40473]MDT0450831.1 DUF397 domain-containing protein [Streptomyces sp. DSM 40473]
MDTHWRKSSFSTDSEGDCVELARFDDRIAMRESDAPTTVLQARRRSVAALIEWQKSSFSGDRDDCIELRRRGDRIVIRESDTPATVLATTPPRLRALLTALKAADSARP